ncbi:MFS transporter [Brevibacillus fulvus]|uniref:MFS family permease n=1 Tax=Brevibacillus fulvus TaxID=1125967 RepID=A0A938XY03_9BACL|nr:MFS family permease [Brevibacillus fulvus]
MSSNHLSTKLSYKSVPINVSFFYGWVIVLISAIGIFFSGPGQTYSNSVFIESYIHDLQLDRTAVSGIYSLATLISGLLLFLVGKAVDRYGRRVMMTLAGVCLGLACFWNSTVAGPFTLFVGFFMVRFFGQGSLTLIPNTLVSQWFIKRRGRALSFAGLGGLLGAACFPPLGNWLIESYGWRVAWMVLGTALLLIFVPIAFFFVRNRPEEVGLQPDQIADKQEGEAGSSPVTDISWTLAEATKTRAFWFMLICTAIPAMIYTGVTFQIFSIMEEHHISRTTTAFVLSLVPLVSFVCSLASGFIVERVKVHTMFGLTLLLNIAAPLLLIFAHSDAMVFCFAIAWGVAQGFMNIPLNVVWPNYFGRKHLGSINSVTTAATVIGSALGPIPFGWVYDYLGAYNPILWVTVVFWGLGALLAFLSPQPMQKPRLLSPEK